MFVRHFGASSLHGKRASKKIVPTKYKPAIFDGLAKKLGNIGQGRMQHGSDRRLTNIILLMNKLYFLLQLLSC